MQRSIEEEVSQFLATLDQKNTGGRSSPPSQKDQEQYTDPEETYHIYPIDGGLVILKEDPAQEYGTGTVVDSLTTDRQNIPSELPETAAPAPANATQEKNGGVSASFFFAIFLALLIPVGVLLLDLALILNPPTATITIVPVTHNLTTTQTLQITSSPKTPNQILGQVFSPLSITQSVTVPATGHAHQDAKAATGTLTFYNLSLTAQTVEAGTQITGEDGTQIVTDQAAIIPPASQTIPPTYGQVSTSAHALNSGPQGNIQRGDINGTYGQSILVQNPVSFTGGVAARDFTIATKSDISNATNSLVQELTQNAQAALNTKLQAGIGLIFSCSNTTHPDHRIGQEATQIAITGSVTCLEASYDISSLQKSIARILNNKAQEKFGPGYTLFSQAQIEKIHAQILGNQAYIQIRGTGVSFYQIGKLSLTELKKSLAGKTEAKAHAYLTSLPWVSQVNISGLYDDQTRLPTDTNRIKMAFIIISV